MNRKLGKKKARFDSRTLMMAKYLIKELPTPPSVINFGDKVSNWGMYLNDQIGDCTIAASAHLILQWTANTNGVAGIADNDILAAYEAITGYNPNDPNTDQGAVELDVLKYWQNSGIASHKIGAFVALDPQNINHLKASVYLFGGSYIGIALPISAQNQDIWDLPIEGASGDGSPGSWGGHAVEVCGYDENYIYIVTWGAIKKMTYAFWLAYCDEAYAIISNDFLVGNKTIEGFDIDTLNMDLNLVKG